MIAPLPPDESLRLEALYRLRVLDTPGEETFDRITRLAARLFDVPIALISLVDAERQWFKSRFGMGDCETSRDIAFCAHAILRDDVMVVPDATQDPRFAGFANVTGAPGIRFYAGAPLIDPQGYKLGTLCVIDTRPRQFTPKEASLLADLATVVAEQLHQRLAAEKIAAAEREQ